MWRHLTILATGIAFYVMMFAALWFAWKEEWARAACYGVFALINEVLFQDAKRGPRS